MLDGIIIPPGLISVLLGIWNTVRSTFGSIFSDLFNWASSNILTGSILSNLLGPGLIGVLLWRIGKYYKFW